MIVSAKHALLAATLMGGIAAQSTPAELHAAFAGRSQRTSTPAIQWLCEEFLPSLPAWPDELDPYGPFALTLTDDSLSIRATATTVPDDLVALGSLSIGGERTSPLLWQCNTEGREQWLVPKTFRLPARWQRLLRALGADRLQTARSLSLPIAAGHLAGSLLEGDPRATALRLGAANCGDVIWMAWQKGEQIRVCGQSAGGLMLPTMLLAMTAIDGINGPSELTLRAFAARDSDREEATRQLGRESLGETDIETLRALLLGNDRTRITAIDALVRRLAAEELPRIVAAASPDHPWATLAAKDAIASLWPMASASVRERTRAAARESELSSLQQAFPVDPPVEQATWTQTDGESTMSGRARLLMLLFLSSVGLLGLWARERVRLRAA